MSYLLKGAIVLNFFATVYGFLPTVVPKLRQSYDVKYHMSLNRREFINKPIDILKIASVTPLLLNLNVVKAETESEDYWTKHNGAFGEEFLKDLNKKDSGLLYKDIVVGKGETPKDGDAVTIQMVGYIYETGEKWTNTYKGIPAFQSVVRAGSRPNQKYMKGLNEGVADMKRGGKRLLVIPAYLAYSYLTIYSEKDPSVEIIPGGSSLVCYIEMIDFRTLKN